MKTVTLILLTLFITVAAHAADEIYVTTLADAQATLSNGATFTMEKGDFYPFIGYDPSQTLVQLKLGSLTFWARKSNISFVSEADTPTAAKKYISDATKFFAESKSAEEQPQVQQPKRSPFQGFRNTALDRPAQPTVPDQRIQTSPAAPANADSGSAPYVPRPPTKAVGGYAERKAEEADIKAAIKLYGHWPSNNEMIEYRKTKLLRPTIIVY